MIPPPIDPNLSRGTIYLIFPVIYWQPQHTRPLQIALAVGALLMALAYLFESVSIQAVMDNGKSAPMTSDQVEIA
jgi:hypothetical protein